MKLEDARQACIWAAQMQCRIEAADRLIAAVREEERELNAQTVANWSAIALRDGRQDMVNLLVQVAADIRKQAIRAGKGADDGHRAGD